MNPSQSIAAARQYLQGCQRLSVLTGAGISAESGIPTFRDPGGLWENFKPEEVATPEAFARDPAFVWEFYATRMEKFHGAQPNPGHQALATLEQQVQSFWLITQNIDNLHHRAGSQRVTELHGNIWRTRCVSCTHREELQAVPESVPPICQQCGDLMRPDVVWFGEMLDLKNIEAAEAACHCEVFIVAGTSGEVWPAAGFCHQAKANGAFVIEVNTQPSALSEIADVSLLGRCGEVLPQLLEN